LLVGDGATVGVYTGVLVGPELGALVGVLVGAVVGAGAEVGTDPQAAGFDGLLALSEGFDSSAPATGLFVQQGSPSSTPLEIPSLSESAIQNSFVQDPGKST